MHGVVFYIFDVSQCRGGTGLRVVRRHVQRAGAARPVPEAGGALNRCYLRARMCEHLFMLRRASFAVWLCCFREIYLFSDLLMDAQCHSVQQRRLGQVPTYPREDTPSTGSVAMQYRRGRSPCSIDGVMVVSAPWIRLVAPKTTVLANEPALMSLCPMLLSLKNNGALYHRWKVRCVSRLITH